MGQGVSAIRRHSNDHFYAAVQQGITLTTFLDIEMSNDKFKYPTNDKNSDPGVKLNNC